MVGIIGNSKVLAKLDDVGSIEYTFFPHLGFEKHIFDSAFALLCDNELKWHWDYSWEINQDYLEDTNILKTTYSDKHFFVSSEDYVSIAHNLLVKNITIYNNSNKKKKLKLFFYENIRMGENPRKSTVKFLKTNNCLVKSDKKYIFCIGSGKKISSYQCGIRASESSAYKDIENGLLKEQSTATGNITDSALCWDIELSPNQKSNIPIYIIMEEYDDYHSNMIDVVNNLNQISNNLDEIYKLTHNYWIDAVKSFSNLNISNNLNINKKEWKNYVGICKRAILAILLLKNYDGGIIASPSFYPDYRYVWNRDASYISIAMDLYGISGVSEKFFEWCERAQNKDGSWVQNYFIGGKPRLTAMQDDQVGITIYALLIHYKITNNRLFLKRYWDMVKKAGDYMNDVVVSSSSCYDLWEENVGIFSYTIGALYAGLKSAIKIAEILHTNDFESIEKWSNAVKFIEDNMYRFYSEKENRFLKSINPRDKTIDASILGLSFPYNLIPADDPRMISTAEQIESAFNYKIGGIGRYPEDVYFGGNPWIITTIWLYLYYAQLIEVLSSKNAPSEIIEKYKNKCDKLLKWSLKYQFNGLFPEQIHKDMGAPISAIPLGWSHAMILMALHNDTISKLKI